MKTLFLICTASLLSLTTLVGCCGDDDLAARNKAVVVAATEAMNNQQFDRLDEYFGPNLIRHCQATPDVQINSLDEMIAFVQKWTAAFPDMRSETHSVVAEGDMVALYGTFVGTHQGPMGDIPATGKTMDSKTFAFFRLEEGKIVEMWVTWDNMAILKQLGLYPPPDPGTGEGQQP
jgi:steroid delta-isomerase-like uncharacterized protein